DGKEEGKSQEEAESGPEKKRQHTESEEKAIKEEKKSEQPAPSNPFTNASKVSPFASLAQEKASAEAKSATSTSSSAFSKSSLAGFAGSTASPFAALGAQAASSPFKPAAKPPTETNTTPKEPETASTEQQTKPTNPPKPSFASFAGDFKASPFASAKGFAAAAPKLSSFASPASGGGFGSGASVFGSGAPLGGAKPAPFGTPATAPAPEPKTEEEKKEAEVKAKTVTGVALKEEPEKTGPGFGEEDDEGDERFQHREIETGEENEMTVFSCRAKLFRFANKEWKERGVGVIKINVSEKTVPAKDEDGKEKEGEEEKKVTARLVMRADGVLSVILNTPLFKGMKIGDPAGNKPSTKAINLTAVEDGKPELFTIRVHNVDVAKEMHKVVQEVLKEL
ncbi:hypothetical protein KEM55_005242, partial [Ascosphaera atra]